MSVHYLRLETGVAPPLLTLPSFKAVLIASETVASDRQREVADWLVRSGCLFFMASGVDCAVWEEAVDHAYLAANDYEVGPDETFVMTTEHSDEPLSETFWFAGHAAHHPEVDLDEILIVDIGSVDRRHEMLTDYAQAQGG